MENTYVAPAPQETIIKSKRRVQKHGEVFTPKWMVDKMLDVPGVKEACNSVTATFLEPAVGEGTFLIEILKRKLKVVSKKHCSSMTEYENYSLLALSSLYGIELLEDNAHICIMNIFKTFLDYYIEVSKKLEKPINNKVLASAKVIISSNIRQGNFLTRLAPNGESIRFSEWRVTSDLSKKPKVIKVDRTEYTLDEIYGKQEKEIGSTSNRSNLNKQLTIFDFMNQDKNESQDEQEVSKYITVKIVDVYKEEMEVYTNE
jgi:hypothetical protein